MAKRKEYNEILESHPEFEGVITEKSWNFIKHSDKSTLEFLQKDWIKNLQRNIKSKRLKRHGGLDRDCIGFGKNKAVIGIGAGSSLKKNIDVLKEIHDMDGIRHYDDRDFIFVASNHMFKPLLEKEILPDFVILADASDVVMDQLTKDIPESGRNTVLIAGLQCSPRVLKKWEKQGRDIRFYLTSSEKLPEEYERLTNKDQRAVIVQQGGNVLNTCWSMGLKFFKSSVFMALGNDLSYELHDDIDERRKGFYADGDYSTNAKETGTGRDEAQKKEVWMGFKLSKSNIISLNAKDRYNVELYPVGTTGNLWVYKTWIESNVLANVKTPIKYRYYNCTEGGIAGVMCKKDTPEGRDQIENWFLLDEVCPKWKTRMFRDAISEFLQAKDYLRNGPSTKDVQGVIDLVPNGGGDIARHAMR